jgi:hypothetical protein
MWNIRPQVLAFSQSFLRSSRFAPSWMLVAIAAVTVSAIACDETGPSSVGVHPKPDAAAAEPAPAPAVDAGTADDAATVSDAAEATDAKTSNDASSSGDGGVSDSSADARN